MIRHGDADLMLSGGSHSMIHPLRRHRLQPADGPVHAQRRAAQGVAAVRPATATASSSAKAPACWCWKSWSTPSGAARTIYAELTGYGSTADAFRVTDSHPDGRGAIACIAEAAGRRAA